MKQTVTETRLAASQLLSRQKRWMLQNPEKRAAHEAVRRAILRGDLIKGPCEVCGATEHVDAHHPRYDRPLDVTWLCRRHHAARHRKPLAKVGTKHRLSSGGVAHAQ